MTTHEQAIQAIRTLLEFIGEDPSREGLADTPDRAVRAWQEWTRGYQLDPAKILERTFGDVGDYDEMIIVRDIRVESTCEHHLAPIIGHAWVGYIPRQTDAGQVCVVGLSKIPRAVEALAKRLQVQERLTSQIASALEHALDPLGVAVVVRATHHCMCTRGVHQTDAAMVTSAMRGVFRTDAPARAEFMALAGIR